LGEKEKKGDGTSSYPELDWAMAKKGRAGDLGKVVGAGSDFTKK